MQVTSSRDEEIRAIHIKYTDFYQIGGGILLVGLGIWIGSLMFQDGYTTNVYTEILSVLATIVILDRLNDWRARSREREALQKRLVREAGSSGQAVAVTALDRLRAEGWLYLLKGANLQRANWERAFVGGLDLTGANLYGAKLQTITSNDEEGGRFPRDGMNHPVILQEAKLVDVNLQQANLEFANLKRANLEYANLQNANLDGTNLKEANLYSSNLQQINLRKANLQGATLAEANLQQANLLDANLQNANLLDANLQNADLRNANLQNANLMFADIQKTSLESTNLRGVRLWTTDLQQSNLRKAYLQGANLWEANLRNANLKDAKFDEKTVLPDAQIMTDENNHMLKDEERNPILDKYWTPETDMSRYTDPSHPDFWEAEWVKKQREKDGG